MKDDVLVVHCQNAHGAGNRRTVAVLLGDLTLSWSGLILPLGPIATARWEISPRPDGWRVKFFNSDGTDGPWFITSESEAMAIESMLDESRG